MLRRLILNLHLYGGLFCFSYLLLLGISVINFNHPLAFTKPSTSAMTWSQPIVLQAGVAKTSGDNNEAILRALGSFAQSANGTYGSWVDADTYHAHLVRPGTTYDVDVRRSTGIATITRTRTGFWTLIRDLHGSGTIYADSKWASSWAWYTDFCVFVVVFAGISGVYLWTARKRERYVGLVLLGFAGVVSITLMLLVTFVG